MSGSWAGRFRPVFNTTRSARQDLSRAEAGLRATEASFEAILDDILGTYGSSQILIHNISTATSIQGALHFRQTWPFSWLSRLQLSGQASGATCRMMGVRASKSDLGYKGATTTWSPVGENDGYAPQTPNTS